MPKSLAWIDIETTGLEIHDAILEVALVVTTYELEEIYSYEAVVHRDDVDTLRSTASQTVRDMHDRNGLWSACKSSKHPMFWVAAELESKIPRGSVLAGSSVNFDRKMLEKHMPEAAARLHYRTVDVSSFLEVLKAWYGEDPWFQTNRGNHRAMADIRSSIAKLQYIRNYYFLSFEQHLDKLGK